MSGDCGIQIRMVQQLDDRTCGHACLSMVTGLPIAGLIKRFGGRPINDEVEAIALTELGILPVPVISLGGLSGMDRCGVYLLTVPSLNRLGLAHRIVGQATPDDWQIFDPQFGRPERKAYGLDAFRHGDPKIEHFSECVYLHAMLGHRGNSARGKLYAARAAGVTE